MCRSLFERLTSDEFAISAGSISTPEALRRFLLRSKEVREIRESLRQGAITEETVREFVSSLMRAFHVGQRFVHEMALAALAVALERRPTDFAEEFLHDLSRLKLAELCLCLRVARVCIQERSSVASHSNRTFALGSPNVYAFSNTPPTGSFSSYNSNLTGVA
jgi:hypothetical protein